ncbi:DUF899 family protein [Pelagibius litoralis]|uniref:DUF899 family protein n=2 Tax=Pelagibius litoralis TaxID=374515 RepID=A0A967KI40_9PROT|nr:DUF899 family protein [Pelagibius litoralis]
MAARSPILLPGASAAQRKQRADLLAAEVALKEQREKVAELRRGLPLDTPVETDYVFKEGPADLSFNAAEQMFETRLSALFAPGKDSLILIHFMFGVAAENPCPMCTMWADGYDAVAEHVSQHANLVLVAKAEIGKLRAFASARGWNRLRLLSAQDNSFNADFGMEDDFGQWPGVSVFRKGADGRVYHFYTCSAPIGPDYARGIDLFSPVWHLLDLLPEGRGDWFPSLRYG